MYYYNDGQHDVGPYHLSKLRELQASGIISGHTLVRQDGGNNWTPLEQLIENNLSEHGQASEQGDPYTQNPASPSVPNTRQALTPTADETNGYNDSGSDSLTSLTPTTPSHDEDDQGQATESASGKDGWASNPPAPWRRYGARLFDFTFNGILGFAIIGPIFYAIAPYTADQFFSIFEAPFGPLLDLILSGIVASLIGGALIGVTGMTLGKWVFGVKVTKLDGSQLGLADGIKRDLNVLMRGFGFAIPIVSLVTLIIGYRTLTKTGTTSWDKGQYLVTHRPSSPTQILLNIIGIFMIFVIVGFTRALAEL